MILKRNFDEGADDEFPARQPKRFRPFPDTVRKVMRGNSLQELVQKLEPSIRSWVREEAEHAISSFLRSSNDHNGSSVSRTLQLHFEDEIPLALFTNCPLVTGDSRCVKIVLRDAVSKKVVETSLKLKIVALDGDFSPDERVDWTEQEFDSKIIRAREGKRPLLTGDLIVQLMEGVGYIRNVCFTDNSSWIRGRKFRLGAKVHTVSADVKVREGVSNAFQVKDHRGESYKKHHPPYLNDEVWRLEKIAKDGACYKRLAERGILNVRRFLQLYFTDPNSLRSVLNDGVFSDKKWKTITDHANTCVLDDNEFYMYRAAEEIGLVFNSVFKLVGAIVDGQYQPLDKLNIFQKQMVEKYKHYAYGNTRHFIPVDQSLLAFSGCPLPIQQAHSLSSPGLPALDINRSIEQDQFEVQINSDQYDVAESSHRMQEFSSTSRNSFLFTDPYNWYPTSSPVPLMSSGDLSLNENFQVEEQVMQGNGNGLYIHAVSSDFDTCNSGNRSPRVNWCKLRAIIKWLILVKPKWMLNQCQVVFM